MTPDYEFRYFAEHRGLPQIIYEMDKTASLFWEMRTNGGIEKIKSLCCGEG